MKAKREHANWTAKKRFVSSHSNRGPVTFRMKFRMVKLFMVTQLKKFSEKVYDRLSHSLTVPHLLFVR
jgi:hypothetical protein